MKPLTTVLLVLGLIATGTGYAFASTPGAVLIGVLVGVWLWCAAIITVNARLGILAASVGAAAANGYLFSRKWAADDAPSICSVSDLLNCDVINQSAWSEVGGIPITLFGVAFYAGLAIAAMWKDDSTPHLFTITGLFMVPALLYSVFLAYISKTIGAFCMFCISIYVANLLLVAAAYIGAKRDKNWAGIDIEKAVVGRSMVTVIIVFLVVGVGGYSVWKGKQDAAPEAVVTRAVQTNAAIPADALTAMYSDAQGPIRLDGTEPVLGDPNAKYTVVEFADFGCGHCATAAVELKALIASNADIQLRFRPFPLSGECNPALQGDGGTDRCRAAMAAECAHQQGKFWEYSNKLFKNQRYLDDAALAFQADATGLDIAQWETCMADPATTESIRGDGQAGADAGVTGTPGIFLLGVRPEPIMVNGRVDYIEALVEAVESGRQLPPGGPPPNR